jgi:multicomponent Na+:H+ antiporter subunit D
MIGLPPAAGFVSKWYLLAATVEREHWAALGVVAASTLLNAAYFAPIVYRAFLRPPPAGEAAHGEAPLPMVIALLATAAGTLAFFFFPGVPLDLSRALQGG